MLEDHMPATLQQKLPNENKGRLKTQMMIMLNSQSLKYPSFFFQLQRNWMKALQGMQRQMAKYHTVTQMPQLIGLVVL